MLHSVFFIFFTSVEHSSSEIQVCSSVVSTGRTASSIVSMSLTILVFKAVQILDFLRLTSPWHIPSRSQSHDICQLLPSLDMCRAKHHVLAHSKPGIPRLPHSIMAYLTLYRHASSGYQKGLTLILVNLGFTSMLFKVQKYGTWTLRVG